MAIFVRPDGDQSTGNWTSTPLWQKIDEVTPSDADLVQSENDPANDVFEVTLENQTDPVSSTGHVVRYRYQKGQSGGGQPGTVNLIIGLYQGVTLIASTTHSDISTGFVAGSFTLSGAEADAITDYDDLRVRIDADKSAGARTSWAEISWVEFETPSPAATFDQDDFRIRPSDADPAINANAGADWEAAIDVNASMELDLLFRIRFGIKSTVSAETEGFQARSQKNGTGGYTLIPNNSDPFNSVADQVEIMCVPGSYTDGAATTDLLNAGAGFVAGTGNDDNATAPIVFTVGDHTEIEFTFLLRKLSDTGHLKDGSTGQTPADFFDFRIYRDDGTPLDTYGVTPRITVAHRPRHIGGTYIETPGRNMVVDDDGNMYSLHEYADLPTAAARLVMMKSADAGESWLPVDDAGAPTYTDIETVDMDYVAAQDTIHIAIQGPSDNVHYSTFRVAGHASADTWNLDQLVTTTGTTEDQAVAIAHRDSENDTILFYQGDQVSSRNQINYKRLPDGGAWGTEQNLDSEGGTDMMHVHVAKESDDTLHIFYHAGNGTAGEIWHQTMTPTSDTVDGTRTQVDQSVTIHPGPPGTRAGSMVPPVIWDDGGTVRVGILYINDANDRVYWNQSTVSTPSWGNEVVVSAGQVQVNGLQSRQVNAAIAVDDVDDEPWAFFVDDEVATDRWRLLSDTEVSGSWGTDTERDSAVFQCMRAYHFTHNSGNGGDRVMGLLVNDMRDASSPSSGGEPTGGTDGETGFTRYLEIVLAVGGGQTIAVGTLAETNTLVGVAAEKTAGIGTLAETNPLIPAGAAKTATIGTLTESDVLNPIQARKRATIGTLAETNPLIPIAADKPIFQPVGTLAELNPLIPISPRKIAMIGTIREANNYRLELPGTDGHLARTPSHTDFDTIADIEWRFDLRIADNTPADLEYLLQRWNYATTNRVWRFWITVTGNLSLATENGAGGGGGPGGGSAAIPVAAGTRWQLRVTHDADGSGGNAQTTWYWRTDGDLLASSGWTQFEQNNGAAAQTWKLTPDSAIGLGGQDVDNNNTFTGRIFRALFWTDLTQTSLAADFSAEDFDLGDSGGDTAVDATGKTWTINGAGSVIIGGGPQPISAEKVAPIGTLGELNDLITIVPILGGGQDIAVTTLGETNSLIAIQARKLATIATLAETNSLIAIQARKLATIATLGETNSLIAIQARKLATIGTLAELNSLIAIAAEKLATIGTLAEINTLIAIALAVADLLEAVALSVDRARDRLTVGEVQTRIAARGPEPTITLRVR